MPWEISLAMAGSALIVLGAVAGGTLIELVKAARSARELTDTFERHLPAIHQNLEEIRRNTLLLASSIRTLSELSDTAKLGLEKTCDGIRETVRSFESHVIGPFTKTLSAVSAVLAFGAAFRGGRIRLGILRRRGRRA
jgi:hypothetical protein